jgi:hypothetical protein
MTQLTLRVQKQFKRPVLLKKSQDNIFLKY